MTLKTITLAIGSLVALGALASEEICYEFIRIDTGTEGIPARPGIVTGRHTGENGRVRTFSQEVIPLNEETQDLLNSVEVGQSVCLKGTRGYHSLPKFFAYAARIR